MTTAALPTSGGARALKLRRAIHCPHCGNTAIYRSRTRGIADRALRFLLNLRPYRCETCTHRFFAFNPR